MLLIKVKRNKVMRDFVYLLILLEFEFKLTVKLFPEGGWN